MYEVQKPLTVKAGEVLPWFSESGGGIQYRLDSIDGVRRSPATLTQGDDPFLKRYTVENTVTTNLNRLAKDLEFLGVPKSNYSVGKNQNERTCIVFDNAIWSVYYSERGRMEDLRQFSDFSIAKIEFLKQVTEGMNITKENP